MTRYEFLKSMGFQGGALMALLASCQSNNDPTPTTTTSSSSSSSSSSGSTSGSTSGSGTSSGSSSGSTLLASVDLTAAANAALKNSGGYIIVNSIVVARTAQNTYVAATQTCSHEPKKKVTFLNGEFFCSEHGARYSTTGVGLNSYGAKGLAVYTVTVNGNTLEIS
ncbi:Rieske (2Fe-2S) protein [Flectobacillus roseus]|uniref:Rieske (2Fe-2S) protein n=1 Tax=Flectobacillus roseus TaxID=502259 RepID=UPI0024B7CE64|nr:Rieske 2Fe-2S domain-containing protein [Flectobacillus roseus]MDI9870690.1 Rieske 2Fe-2S domain-containing protein [Flectobacillus roseus]